MSLSTAATAQSPGLYQIVIGNGSGLVLSSPDGYNIDIETPNGSNPGQLWQLVANGSYYQIVSRTGLVLDDYGNSTTSGTPVDMVSPNGSSAQIWQVIPNGNAYQIIIGNGSGLALDVYGNGTSSGTPVDVAGQNGTTAQNWLLVQPFGADAELIPIHCDAFSGCPAIDEAATAGVQWMRFLAIWGLIEPNAPVTGYHTYSWDQLDYQVNYALSKGINVYLTATWAPQWATGATSNYPSYDNEHCGDCGRTVLDSNNTYSFFYNMASHFAGRVQYFGIWNEPNNSNNYNDIYFDTNSGNYLFDFMNQLFIPAVNGVRAANPGAYIVAPELQYAGNSSCGGFFECDWYSSWMQPMAQYFSGMFDVVSIHLYPSDHNEAKSRVDSLASNLSQYFNKPIWVTELGYTTGSDWQTSTYEPDNLTLSFVDELNRSTYWTKIFYHLGHYEACAGNSGLLCTTDNSTLIERPAFNAYRQFTGY